MTFVIKRHLTVARVTSCTVPSVHTINH